MRAVDANTSNALKGSRAGDRIVAYAWYGGSLAYPGPLPISAPKFSWDTTRQIQSFTCQVNDPDGKLAPWLLSDPLGVGGSQLEVRWRVGGASEINVGWYKIGRNKPKERWRSYVIDHLGHVNEDSPVPDGKRLVYVSGGADIALTCYDRAHFVKRDTLMAPESPPPGSTIIGEIKRLMAPLFPVVVTTAAEALDRAVSTQLVYEIDRLDAIQDLCKRIACDYRFNGDGAMEVYSLARTAPVMVLQGGPEGLLVDVDREQDDSGLRNRFIVDGARREETSDGRTLDVPIRVMVEIAEGDLSAYGPFGRSPQHYQSTMIETYQQAHDYAVVMRDTHVAGMTVDLRVTCLPQPQLQQGDWVQVGNPVVGGEVASLVGMVKSVEMGFTAGAPDRMTAVVQCSQADVKAVIGGMYRG